MSTCERERCVSSEVLLQNGRETYHFWSHISKRWGANEAQAAKKTRMSRDRKGATRGSDELTSSPSRP